MRFPKLPPEWWSECFEDLYELSERDSRQLPVSNLSHFQYLKGVCIGSSYRNWKSEGMLSDMPPKRFRIVSGTIRGTWRLSSGGCGIYPVRFCVLRKRGF